MSKNLQKQRINIELSQIRSILNDFRKTKNKCMELGKYINFQMPKQQYFKNVEKTTLRKMDLLDIGGLVNLKNELVRALTELFEIERELRYKKEKHDARRQMMESQFQELQYIRKNQTESAIQSPSSPKAVLIENFRSIITEPMRQQPSQDPKPKSKNLQIPLYRAKNETNQNKLDRISKYIASLKRNMKLNSQTLGYKWKIKEFLLEDANYVRLRTELERFMMREEELDDILGNAVEKGVRQMIKKSQVVESSAEYKLIKVYKQKPTQKPKIQDTFTPVQSESDFMKITHQSTQSPKRFGRSPQTKEFSHQQTQPPTIDPSYRSPKIKKQTSFSEFLSPSFNSPLRNISSKHDIELKAEQDFNLIKKQLQKSNQNYNQMLSRINKTVEKGSEKLIQLREKRKKKTEKNDEVWDELDKI